MAEKPVHSPPFDFF